MNARRGPKRSETARSAILAATVAQLASAGFDALSIEGIAARAGVGKQTIYRWWRSKHSLVAECVVTGLIPSPAHPPADCGDAVKDISGWIADAVAVIDDPHSRAILRAVVAATIENPDSSASVDDVLGVTPGLIDRLQAARERGEVAPSLDVQVTAQALIGILLARLLAADAGGIDTERIAAALLAPPLAP
jgi:AcrR family transcriptional regulator